MLTNQGVQFLVLVIPNVSVNMLATEPLHTSAGLSDTEVWLKILKQAFESAVVPSCVSYCP